MFEKQNETLGLIEKMQFTKFDLRTVTKEEVEEVANNYRKNTGPR